MENRRVEEGRYEMSLGECAETAPDLGAARRRLDTGVEEKTVQTGALASRRTRDNCVWRPREANIIASVLVQLTRNERVKGNQKGSRGKKGRKNRDDEEKGGLL